MENCILMVLILIAQIVAMIIQPEQMGVILMISIVAHCLNK